MKQFLIATVVILVGFLIYYTLTRRLIEKFIDSVASTATSPNKVLIDETDIPELASGKTIHDVLMEKDLKFLEEQLDIYGKTRSIINKIIATYANILTDEETKEQKTEKALQEISKETFGESPRFCSGSRVKELLATPAENGLEPLFKCIPRDPSRYLLLLSFASKKIKGQLDSTQGILGLQNGSANADDLPPPSEVELSGSRRSASLAVEGFADSVTGSLSADAYISAYALPTVSNSNKSASAPTYAPAPSSADETLIENELTAWKSAFNSESMARIKQYLKYCTAALKDIDDINKAGQDGSLIKKINMDKIRNGVVAQLQNRELSDSGNSSFNIPF